MTTKKNTHTSAALRFLEGVTGGSLKLGGLLESIRQGERISQTELAEKLGVSRSHLCDIEKGRKTVSPARAARFAKVLGYSEKQFVRLALQDMVDDAGLALIVKVQAA